MARREVDRRDRDRDDFPHKRTGPTNPAPRPKLDEFWLDGEGIDRQVLQSTICRFLGPEATSRPFDYQGKPGFKIKAIRTFTPDMLDDLKNLSQAFMQENRNARAHNRSEIRYEDSETKIHKDLPGFDDYDGRDRNYPPTTYSSSLSSPFATGSSASGYAPMEYTTGPYQGPTYTMAPPTTMHAPYDPRYQQDYAYPQGSRDLPPAGYYPPGSAYPDPGRSRGQDIQTGYYPVGGPPVGRGMMDSDPRDPRFAGYPDAMTGVQQSGIPYGGGVPPRGQNPSPYEPPRDHYARPPPPTESYGTRRR